MESSDYERSYLTVAQALISGEGLDTLPDIVAIRYPIGFPLYIAAHIPVAARLGVTTEAAIGFTQALLAGATTALLFLLADRTVGRLPALLAALMWGLYPRVLWFTRHPNSEVLFTFLLYFALFYLVRAIQRRHFWSMLPVALLVGICALVRPIGIGLSIVFALILALQRHLTRKERLLFIGALLLLNVTVWAPWESYLWQRTGELQPLAVNDNTSVYDGITWAIYLETPPASLPTDVYELMQRAAARKQELTRGTLATVAFLWEEMQQRPLTVLKLFLIKLARGLYANQGMEGETLNLLMQLPIVLLSVWGLVGAWRDPGTHPYAIMGLLLVLYFWGMTTLVLSISRYMIPVTGLLFIFVGYRVARLLERWPAVRAFTDQQPPSSSGYELGERRASPVTSD
ncbi:MAG TPA: glycosyltransferase family 39 protein [Ardenticatenaceae bacterium]|jgi:4-amino-4-deoxy-L-arabinose transferase-like glycosyltransferase